MTTIHANSCRDAVHRVVTMCLMSGVELPVSSILEQIASAIDIIVQTERMVDGKRRIVEISELTGVKGNEIVSEPIYRFLEKSYTSDGEIAGEFTCVNIRPTVFEDLERRRIKTMRLGQNVDREENGYLGK
jgi:pilus assembly protein CpaF